MSNIIPFPARIESELEQRVAETAERLADWNPPTKATIGSFLISVRTAHNIVAGTDAQLRKFLTETEPQVLDQFMEELAVSADFFEGLSQLCELAGERVVAAAKEAGIAEA